MECFKIKISFLTIPFQTLHEGYYVTDSSQLDSPVRKRKQQSESPNKMSVNGYNLRRRDNSRNSSLDINNQNVVDT